MSSQGDTTGNVDPNDEALACRRFRVTGYVQGVFYRARTHTVARDLGLGGSARNLDDGSVEVLACGGIDALDALQRCLHEGPAMASVSTVTVVAQPSRDIDAFTTG
jgi:acylphosphatase